MKTLTILFTLFYFLNALAVAPYGIKGQQQAPTLYSNVHQFPNNQVTNLGGINALVESGNSNILSNPSFEHSTFSTDWSFSGTSSFFEDLTRVLNGKKSSGILAVSQSFALVQDSTLYASQFAGQVQGLAMVRIKANAGATGIKVCSRQAGVTSTTNCVDVVANDQWNLYKVPFILGATSNGISIASTGNTTSVVYIDDAFVGAQDIAQVYSAVGPWTSYTPAIVVDTGSITNSTITAKWRQVGEQLEVSGLVRFSALSAAFTGLNISIPSSFTIDATKLPGSASGLDLVLGEGSVYDTGLNLFPTKIYYNGNTSYFQVRLFSSGSGLNPVLTNSAAVITNTNPIAFNNADTINFNFTVPVTQFSGATSVYTSNNADTDWSSCGLTGAAFTGFGSAVPTPSLQCKRQGSDLLMKGTITAGTTPTAVEARMALPLWQGVQLVSAGSSIIPSIQAAGVGGRSDAPGGIGVLIETSSTYVTFSQYADATRFFLTKQNASVIAASGTSYSFNARIPINGWNNSNIIIGSFNGLQSCTDTLACTDTFSAQVSALGVVSGENVDWLNGNCARGGTNNAAYNCAFKSGVFTTAPNCQATSHDNSTQVAAITLQSTSTNILGSTTSAGVFAQQQFQVTCQKTGADYIGKTAMAVASDQNVRSIGSTNVDIQSVYFGSGANCATACSTGTCTICRQVGNKITSITFVSTGTYEANGIDGLNKYSCSGNGFIGGNYGVINHDLANSTTAKARLNTGAGASTANAAYAQLTCIGVP